MNKPSLPSLPTSPTLPTLPTLPTFQISLKHRTQATLIKIQKRFVCVHQEWTVQYARTLSHDTSLGTSYIEITLFSSQFHDVRVFGVLHVEVRICVNLVSNILCIFQ
jgi:hypothetical protein